MSSTVDYMTWSSGCLAGMDNEQHLDYPYSDCGFVAEDVHEGT